MPLNSLASRILNVRDDFHSDMCVNGRFITNRYTGQQFWVKCGHCKSCLQEAADMRSQRIRNEYDGVTPIYFITLTYDRLSCPYFVHSDYLDIRDKGYGELNIYRKHTIKWNVNSGKYVRHWKPVKLFSVPVDINSYDGRWMPFLRAQFGCVGINYFKDVQDFQKRLRIYLKRKYNYNEKIRFFSCTEYGGSSFRPHAHLLAFARNLSKDEIHNACIACWPYGRHIRNPKSCQLVSKDPASYVSSYVNRTSKLPSFLARYFPQRYSASKHFGHGQRAFSLEEISKKVSNGDLSFTLRRITKTGEVQSTYSTPKYVINRFFPICKGFSRLTRDTLYDFLSSGFEPAKLRSAQLSFDARHPKFPIGYDRNKEEISKICVRFLNAYFNYKVVFPQKNLLDYTIDYFRTWDVWKSTCYRLFRQDDKVQPFYKFDNMCLQTPIVQQEYYKESAFGIPFIVNNNEKPNVVARTVEMESRFDEMCKHKEVNNAVMNRLGILV